MSKVILIMDKPENCLKCEFCDRRLDGTLRCTRNKVASNVVFGLAIPDWCPLKDVPDKYWPVSMNFERGWNACIDEILKERD